MQRLLVTAFEPFNQEPLNSSAEVLKKLRPEDLSQLELHRAVLPVVFDQCFELLREHVETLKPDWVVSLGQANGRTHISPERVAINLVDARIPDNSGIQPREQLIAKGEAVAYWSQLPIQKMTASCVARSIPAEISCTAGTYVCNYLFYRLMTYCQRSAVRGGFIHLPDLAHMPLAQMASGITLMLQELQSQ